MSAELTPETVRAFVAVPLDDAVREAVGRLVEQLRKALPGPALRWSRPDQIHLTLRFFGDIGADSVASVRAAVERGCRGVGPITLRAANLGAFPDSRNPRVLWVDVGGQTSALRCLQEQIQRETAGFGEPPEPRAFAPHLTLARVKNASGAERRNIAEQLRRFGPVQLGAWTVDRAELMRSELSPSGSRYTVLASIPLLAT